MNGITKQRDGQWGFDGGHGCAVLIGRPDRSPVRVLPAIRAEKWAGSRWGSCWLDLIARDVAPDVAAERIVTLPATANRAACEALEIQAVRGKGSARRSEVHRIAAGSTEWDIEWQTFADVPAGGAVEFDLTLSAGAVAHHQPALTQAEIDAGADRPENVVNSYAIYGPVGGNYARSDGTLIEARETGKLAHLYRPVCIAADGSWAWASQAIDNGVLRITLPMEWLAAAAFPVTLDPTFGFTSVGASNGIGGNGYVVANNHATTEAGSVTSISLYARATQGGIVFALYDVTGSTGKAYNLLGSSGTGSTTAYQWKTLDLSSPVAVVAATQYCLAFKDRKSVV